MIYTVLFSGFLVACVTERMETSDTGPAYLEKQIDEIVARLPYQNGMDLYVDISHLAAYGKFAIPKMRECLKSPNAKVKSSAAMVLGQLRAEVARDDLMAMVNDENKLVRYEAARAVLEIGVWDSIPVLLAGLEDSDQWNRELCLEVLQRKTGENFGFDPASPQEERTMAAEQWKDWWEVRKQDPMYQGNLAAKQ
jgi:hypothetical protein